MEANEVCDALDLEPEEVADVFRLAAAHELRKVASDVEDTTTDLGGVNTRLARRYLMLAEEFEELQARRRTDDADVTLEGGDPSASDDDAAVYADRSGAV